MISLFSFALFSACDSLRDELHAPDGFAGPQMNKLLFAATPDQRADRYLLSLAILVPVMLESSEPGLDTKTSIDRVRNAYGELAGLYEAAAQCRYGSPPFVCDNRDAPSVFQFENMSYDVQKSLYQVAKAIVINLDLDETAEELLTLDATSLSALAKDGTMYFRTFRRGAASYRDAIVIYSNGVANSCVGDNCDTLKALLTNQYSGFQMMSHGDRPASQERYLKKLQRHARDISRTDASNWKLTPELRLALLRILDTACIDAHGFQRNGMLVSDTPSNCGPGRAEVPESEERKRLVSAL